MPSRSRSLLNGAVTNNYVQLDIEGDIFWMTVGGKRACVHWQAKRAVQGIFFNILADNRILTLVLIQNSSAKAHQKQFIVHLYFRDFHRFVVVKTNSMYHTI